MTPERWREVSERVDAALALPVEARAAYIESSCAEDAELRQEVERLLAACESAGRANFLAGGVTDFAAPMLEGLRARGASGSEAVSDIARTTLAERYAVDRELARGGMATVYLARDVKHDRQVALKVLRPEVAASLGTARFLREIQIAARLNHPHILTLHDSGEAPAPGSDFGTSRLLYYVMPYVEGETLRQRLERERELPLADAVSIAKHVASALDHAHRHGVVHRDIKPENILLHEGEAIVADFGIAHAIGAAAADGRLTATGVAVGTPLYMSPEQAAGDRDVDGRADIYALGCILYEMLAGEPPFTGATPRAMLARKAVSPPPSLHALRETVPAGVQEVVAKAMANAPADRFATASKFSEALEGALTPAPVSIARRRPRARATALGLLAPLAVALAGAAWRASHWQHEAGSVRIRSLAVLPFDNLTGDSAQEYVAAGMHDALIGEISQIGALRVISRRSVMRYHHSDKTVPEIARELNVDGVVEASVLTAGDSVRIRVELLEVRPEERSIWSREYRRRLGDVLSVYGDVARATASELRITLTPQQAERLATVRAVNPATYQAYLKGMYHIYKQDRASVERGIAILRQAVATSPNDPLAHAGLALGYGELGHGPAPTPDAWPQARAAALNAVRLDSTLAEAHAALAEERLYYEWDWTGAEQSFRHALELNPSLAMAHYHYAWYLALVGRLDEAIEEHKRAKELDPLNPFQTAWLGELYRFKGRYDDAIAEARGALELAADYPPGLLVLGEAYAAKGLMREAIAAHERLLKVRPLFKFELGRTYVAAGRERDARRIATLLEAESPSPWRAYGLVRLYTALGEMDKAFGALAYEPSHAVVPWISVEPEMAALRRDSRFETFRRRWKLPN